VKSSLKFSTQFLCKCCERMLKYKLKFFPFPLRWFQYSHLKLLHFPLFTLSSASFFIIKITTLCKYITCTHKKVCWKVESLLARFAFVKKSVEWNFSLFFLSLAIHVEIKPVTINPQRIPTQLYLFLQRGGEVKQKKSLFKVLLITWWFFSVSLPHLSIHISSVYQWL
jgi:hypothetical protein